jgi:very-short-patch-repair endonuclease
MNNPLCHCGKLATRQIGEVGFCTAHKAEAVAYLAKHGDPRKPKNKTIPDRSGASTRMKKKVKIAYKDKPRKFYVSIERQKKLITNATPAEVLLKELLWNHPDTKGLWVFQPIVIGYYPDFLCPKAKLIVELDGSQHYTNEGLASDSRRTAQLSHKGYRVIRFSNRRMICDSSYVLTTIIATQKERMA